MNHLGLASHENQWHIDSIFIFILSVQKIYDYIAEGQRNNPDPDEEDEEDEMEGLFVSCDPIVRLISDKRYMKFTAGPIWLCLQCHI